MAEKISEEGEKWVPKQGEGICTSIYLSLSPQSVCLARKQGNITNLLFNCFLY